MVQTDVYISHKVLIILPATYEIGFGIGSLVILRPLISYPHTLCTMHTMILQ